MLTQPWGFPSSPISIARTGAGTLVAFLARHGMHHSFSPSRVPFAANIAALKHLGARAILAFSAVGSLREEIAPKDFVIPSQLIDRTKGVRRATYFGEGEEEHVIAHASFGDPFDIKLRPIVEGMYVYHARHSNVQCSRGTCITRPVRQGVQQQDSCLYGGARLLYACRVEHVPPVGWRHHQHVGASRGETCSRGRN